MALGSASKWGLTKELLFRYSRIETLVVPDHEMLPSNLKYALRTLYEEILEFRFDYPLVAVSEAGPKDSLHYYLYKYSKTPPFRHVMRLDSDGIPRVWNRATGIMYRPAFIATFGLRNLGDYLRTGNRRSLEVFLKQVGWLEEHAVVRADGAVVWHHNFDVRDGIVDLKAPWIAANAQGYAISALIRAWRITRRPRLWDLLRGAARVFELDCNRSGVRVQAEGHIVYSETPGLPAPGVMDGFLTSLLGLYDWYVESGDPRVYGLFQQGVEGLCYFLPRWDYRKKWSMYANRYYLCPPNYHSMNRLLLGVLARLTGNSLLEEYARAWDHARLSWLGRAEIYLGFIGTKNVCRLRHRTWRQKAASVPVASETQKLLPADTP